MIIKYIQRLKRSMFFKIRFIVAVGLLTLFYVNGIAPNATFSMLMPKTEKAWTEMMLAKDAFLANKAAPTDAEWEVFRMLPSNIALIEKFKTNFIKEFPSTGVGIRAIAVPGKTEIALDIDPLLGASAFSDLIGVIKNELGSGTPHPVLFDPANIFSSENSGTLGYVLGQGLRTHLTWELMSDCSVQSDCVIFTLIHEFDHVKNYLDEINGVANVYHGTIYAGVLTLLGLTDRGGISFDDGEGYAKDGFNFTELGAHKLQALLAGFTLSKLLNNPLTVAGSPAINEAIDSFLSGFGRSMMMARAQGLLFAHILDGLSGGSPIVQGHYKERNANVWLEVPGEGYIVLANYYINAKGELVTPKGKISGEKAIINAITAQGVLHCVQGLARVLVDIDQLETVARDRGTELDNFGLNDPTNVTTNYFFDTISAAINVGAIFDRNHNRELSAVKNRPDVKKAMALFAAADKLNNKNSVNMQRGVISGSANKNIPKKSHINDFTTTSSGTPQSPLVANFSPSSTLGKRLTGAVRDKPKSMGQPAVDYTYTQANKLLTDAGVAAGSNQPVVVSNGSVFLSYDYGWYINSSGSLPDFIFDSTEYISGRICASCYSFNIQPMKTYQESMGLVSNIFEDYYNDSNAGGIKITLKDPVDGVGRSLAVGDIVGKRTAVFTEAALINEAAKNGSVSKQELNDRLTNLAEQNEKLKILLGFLDDVISGKTLVDFIDGAVDKPGDIKKTPGLDSTGNLAIKQIMNSTSAILGDEGKSPSMDVNLGVPGQQGIQASENAPSTSGTTVLDQTLAQAQANATPTVDSFPDQATTASAYVSLITAGNNSVPTLAGVDSATGAVAIAVPKTTTDVTNMVTAIAQNIKAANDAIKNAGNSPVAAQAALDAVNNANAANAAMTKAINDKAISDAPKATSVTKTVTETVTVNVPYCSYGGAEGPCSTANSLEDARIAAAVAKATSYLDSNYKLLVKTDFFPVLYDRGGTYVEGGCDGAMGPIISNGNGGGSIQSCTRSGTGKTPKGLTAGEFIKAQAYRQQVRDNFIAANTPVRASIVQTKIVVQTGSISKNVIETKPAVPPTLISYSAIDTTGITNKINDFGQQAAAQALKDANVFTTVMASSGCDMICQFFKLPQNPLSSNMTLEQAKNIIANTSGSNSVSSVEVQNSLISSYYTKDGLFKDGGTQINQFPAITIDYSNSCK